MKRRIFLQNSLIAAPMITLNQHPSFSADRPKEGIKVPEGENRLHQSLNIGAARIDCKVSATDTNGNLYVCVSSNNIREEGVPLHTHPDLDETFFVMEGQVKIKVGDEVFYLNPGDHLFAPRNIPHSWVCNSLQPAKLLITAQPAGNIEAFFLAFSKVNQITPEIAASLYEEHNMMLLGPPVTAD
jgi:mannose-6-phosphate isomerase-like protein (cupin superfamily)